MNNQNQQIDNSTKELAQALAKNDHTLVAMTAEEFVDFIVGIKNKQGMTRQQVIIWLDDVINKSKEVSQSAKNIWNSKKAILKNGGSYLPVLSDSKTLFALAQEMQKSGSVFTKYRVSTHSGKAYVVFKGYAGLRTHLTGTRYLASNPKVISMGVGKLGAANAIKGGIVITIVFSVAFHALDQLLNDRATWHDFVAGVTVDVVSAVTGGAIAWGAVSAVVGATAMAAIGPIALVVVVGAGVTYALNALADHYNLTEKLATLLKESEARMKENTRQIKEEIRRGLNYADEDPVGFMHRLFGVPYFGPNYFRR